VQLNFWSQKDAFINNLVQSAKNEPVTFSSGSTKLLETTKHILDEEQISNIILSSETPDEEKKLIYKSFENKKPLKQVIMYTPTLTVGVSNNNDVKKHYHYDPGKSMDVLSSFQMIKRTRNANEINFHLVDVTKYLPIEYSDIHDQLSDFMAIDDDGDVIGINEVGKKFAVVHRVHNILENLHKEAFKRLLLQQFTLKVKKIDDVVVPRVAKISRLLSKKEKENNKKLLQEFIKMYKTNDEYLYEILNKPFLKKKEKIIYSFYEQYENLKERFTENEIIELLNNEIEKEGYIECFLEAQKNNIELPKVLNKKQIKKYKKYKKLYKRKRNRWYLILV
jgi:hypothetical protein